MTASSNVNSAYTLIEILVVLAILSLFLGIGYANLRDYHRRQAVIGAAREVEGALRYAQVLALAGTKPPGCATFEGISFRTTGGPSGSNNYQIWAECIPSSRSAMLKGKNLASSLILRDSSPGQQTLFQVLAKGVINSKTFCICDNYGNRVGVSVSSSGEINETSCTIGCP